MRRPRVPLVLAAGVAGSLAVGLTVPASATATARAGTAAPGPKPVSNSLPKVPVMRGGGGAVSSVDAVASQVGIDVLKAGGNAADAAVATAAALGVTEPYSTGIGGGGFFVFYDAKTGQVKTIDGRETAPRTFTQNAFLEPDGTPMAFDKAVNSGLSVGVPGSPATWDLAARTFGTQPLGALLKPAETIARRGFVVDQTFHDQTAANAKRFSNFPATAKVFLPGGSAPAVGSVFRNPDMAAAYRELRTHGVASLYAGRLGQAVVAEAENPHTKPGLRVPHGQITTADLRAYRALPKAPVHSQYRGLDVYGMPVPSSGGIAVAEILNLLEAIDQRTGTPLSAVSNADYLHRFSEASALAFADRNRYVGDVPGVPTSELVSQGFADERACLFSPDAALKRPVPFGSPDGSYSSCGPTATTSRLPNDGQSTSHLVVTDKWGNAVSYTLTIEQTGGSAITVPGWGFLLNNELTDFDFVPLSADVPDPNLPGPGKRPRSSMSPTVILDHGQLRLVAGSPGGATIITTVAQVLTEYLDRGMSLVDAIAAARLSSRNGVEQAEPALLSSPDAAALTAKGHVLMSTPEIGAATAIRVVGPNDFEAAAETVRRGGGSAMVVNPR
ncbi:gamma-glutamyltransferase [Nostocoides sp. HKS02]|uniref:gamma-glutamyltransferase n=1 Tax=Nostocoides sp. HKS02 TaxID=1813880 RepID=UPI0012B443A1|nr:gamma-glutamyltransferase [Tetrasphaera sp. HKS02]QGN56944.1 gamma-glutamyltransferase [Tetrasphaera sp. HKS02]